MLLLLQPMLCWVRSRWDASGQDLLQPVEAVGESDPLRQGLAIAPFALVADVDAVGVYGRRTTKRAPGRASSTCTVPPWLATAVCTMARPSPVPPSSRLRAPSRRVKRSKIRSRSCGEIPAPSSATVNSTIA